MQIGLVGYRQLASRQLAADNWQHRQLASRQLASNLIGQFYYISFTILEPLFKV